MGHKRYYSYVRDIDGNLDSGVHTDWKDVQPLLKGCENRCKGHTSLQETYKWIDDTVAAWRARLATEPKSKKTKCQNPRTNKANASEVESLAGESTGSNGQSLGEAEVKVAGSETSSLPGQLGHGKAGSSGPQSPSLYLDSPVSSLTKSSGIRTTSKSRVSFPETLDVGIRSSGNTGLEETTITRAKNSRKLGEPGAEFSLSQGLDEPDRKRIRNARGYKSRKT